MPFRAPPLWLSIGTFSLGPSHQAFMSLSNFIINNIHKNITLFSLRTCQKPERNCIPARKNPDGLWDCQKDVLTRYCENFFCFLVVHLEKVREIAGWNERDQWPLEGCGSSKGPSETREWLKELISKMKHGWRESNATQDLPAINKIVDQFNRAT